MIKLYIILLMFTSIGLLAYQYLPAFMHRYAKIQKVRVEKATTQLDNMFIFTQRRQLFRLYAITPVTLALLGFVLMRHPIGLIGGLFLGLVAPSIIIKNMSSTRRNQFQKQLVDGLMLLSASLKAGMSLNQALGVLVEEMPAPISDEFALVVRENSMGVGMQECLAHLKRRMPIDDLDLIIAAIGIVRDTGGDLTEVLGNLVFTIREKQKLNDRVKALTVQGRLQGYIMMVLPVAFSVFIYFVNPENFQVMLNDKLGQTLLMWAIISEGLGIIFIKKFSKIEV